MQTPICEICLKSNDLCEICKKKLETDKITQAEIDISRFICELSEKVGSLQDVKIKKIIESNNIIIISGKGDGGKLVGKAGTVVKVLAKQFGKSIKIVEKTDNYKDFMNNLISPNVIKAINIVYTPNGEIYKLRITSTEKTLPIQKDEISHISLSMFGNKAEIVFEN